MELCWKLFLNKTRKTNKKKYKVSILFYFFVTGGWVGKERVGWWQRTDAFWESFEFEINEKHDLVLFFRICSRMNFEGEQTEFLFRGGLFINTQNVDGTFYGFLSCSVKYIFLHVDSIYILFCYPWKKTSYYTKLRSQNHSSSCSQSHFW